ncbi:MAG TPA: flavin reductase family protein [Conexibacter sp.]|jgi:flavin reductase (DIM6/NTAB) family NADH-FMN oxidoreductase RutF
MTMRSTCAEPSSGPSGLDRELLRDVLSSFPAGVVIVTALDGERPVGLTVNAFCSVSADPPLVLVCVDKGSNTLAAISDAGAFTVNILAAGREQLALLFASKARDKFSALAWREAPGGAGGPVLSEDAAAYLACRVERAIEAGDHWIFIGAVSAAGVHEEPVPLLYHRRAFAALA